MGGLMRFLKYGLIGMLLILTLPVNAVERTGILAPADVKKEQDEVMQMLISGNKINQAHIVLKPGLPKLMMVSCADSRVEPEVIFHMKPGEIYTVRAFGNIVDKSILGSLEYGADKLQCRVLVVLGHTHCSALQEAISEHDNPTSVWRSLNLQDLNDRLQPAVESVTDKSLSDNDRLDAVVRANVLNTMRTIREESPDLWQLEQDDMLKIVGGIYHLNTGKVEWLKE
jgi:carbonic anhydrase